MNPLQLLVMGLVETVVFVINCHIGYSLLGAVDVGKSVYCVHIPNIASLVVLRGKES